MVIVAPLHRKALVPPLVHMPHPGSSVGCVITLGMRQSHPLHKCRQIPILPRPQQQMPVIAHHTISANTHPSPLLPFGECLLKRLKIPLLLKYPQTPIGAVKNVIKITPKSFSLRSWHNNRSIQTQKSMSTKKRSQVPLIFPEHMITATRVTKGTP